MKNGDGCCGGGLDCTGGAGGARDATVPPFEGVHFCQDVHFCQGTHVGESDTDSVAFSDLVGVKSSHHNH